MNQKAEAAVDRIDQIAQQLMTVVPNLVLDLREEITAAITAAIDESQSAASEEPPRTVKAVLTIPISVKWALDSLAVEVKASVSTKTTATQTIELEDPNQPQLPGVADSVRKLKSMVQSGELVIKVGGAK